MSTSHTVSKVEVSLRRMVRGQKVHALPSMHAFKALCGAEPRGNSQWDEVYDAKGLTCRLCRMEIGVQRVGATTVYTCEALSDEQVPK